MKKVITEWGVTEIEPFVENLIANFSNVCNTHSALREIILKSIFAGVDTVLEQKKQFDNLHPTVNPLDSKRSDIKRIAIDLLNGGTVRFDSTRTYGDNAADLVFLAKSIYDKIEEIGI
jgi:hypothetical protein